MANRRSTVTRLAQRREEQGLEGGFITELAHEMRTPLNSVIGFASIIQSGKAGPVNEKQREFLGHILGSARHLLELVNDALDMAKLDAGKVHFEIEPVALAPMVNEVCGSMHIAAEEKSVALSATVDPVIESVMLDRTRLRQVMLNYLSNAIKFTANGGRVTLRVAPAGENAIRIDVEDTGIGISDEDATRLFNDFQQLDPSGAKDSGFGLGLALTKRIVEAQGGSVGVRSIRGTGSTFWAILPAPPAR